MWICMIFMVLPVVEPMKMGLLACSRVFGVDRRLSLSVIWGITRH